MSTEASIRAAEVGARVWFAGEKKPYKVRARNERYLICTKPFNPKRTVLYTIVDLERRVRGRDNMIFGMGYETDEDIAETMAALAAGDVEVSYRHFVNLEVERVERE